jgi:molybdate/tungstate transport system substrate-binding protein
MTYKARGGTGRAASIALVLVAAALSGCAADSSAGRGLEVLYAGSLATVMENGLGPAFAAAGTAYHGEAHGSLGAGRLIRDHLRTPDVFISADPTVNETVLMGKENEDLVTWFVTFASSQLVLAYNPRSRFAAP